MPYGAGADPLAVVTLGSSGGQVAERMCPQLGRLDGAEPMQAAEGSACPPGPANAHAAKGETYVCRNR